MDHSNLEIPDHSILGINYSGMHDSSIAIVSQEGEVLYAVSLERVSRKKQDGSFPDALLKNIPWENIDSIALSNVEKYVIPQQQESTVHPVRLKKELPSDRSHSGIYYEQIYSLKKEIEFFPHHLSHASSVFWGSGFDEALCLVYDGGMRNEHWFGGLYVASQKSGIEAVDLFSAELYSNITFLYTTVTALLGFTPLKHEGKITGLAAYGTATEECQKLLTTWLHNPHMIHGVFDWIHMYDAPQIKIDHKRLIELQEKVALFSREDLAATVQLLTEQHILKIVEKITEQFPNYKNICLSGGLFANVKVNQRIYEYGFKNIFISPPMSDDGTAIGAAWLALGHTKIMKNTKYSTMFLGNSYNIEEFLVTKPKLMFQNINNPAEFIAKKLSAGYICAIFQGRAEFGPRALGNRTILAQATQYDINNGLNERLSRTEFMPFAPIVRDVDASIYFEVNTGELFTSKFMTITTDCTKQALKDCPAVVHIDKTARPEIIAYDDNPFIYDILTSYAEETGIFALVNTSFNIHEEPIVDSHEDAVKGFFESGLDYLYLDGIVISLEENSKMYHRYLRAKITHQTKMIKDISLDFAKLNSAKEANSVLVAQIESRMLEWQKKANQAEVKHQSLVQSRSWRITKPIRSIFTTLRRFGHKK